MTPEELMLEQARREGRDPLKEMQKMSDLQSKGIGPKLPAPGDKTDEQKGILVVPQSMVDDSFKGPIPQAQQPTIPVEQAMLIDRTRRQAQSIVDSQPTTPIIDPTTRLGFNSRAMTMKWMAAGSPGGDFLSPSDAQNFYDKVARSMAGQEETFTNAEWEAFGPQLETTPHGKVVMGQRKDAELRIQTSIKEAVAKNPDLSVEEYGKIVKQAGGKYAPDLAALYGAQLMPETVKAKIAADSTGKLLRQQNDILWSAFAKQNRIDPKNEELRNVWEGDTGQPKWMGAAGSVTFNKPNEEQQRISNEWWAGARSTRNTNDWTGEQLEQTAKASPSVRLMADKKITEESFKPTDEYKARYDAVVDSDTGVTRMPSDTISVAQKRVVANIDKGMAPADAVDYVVFDLVNRGTITSVGRAGLSRFRGELIKSTMDELGASVKKAKDVANQQYQIAEDSVNQRVKAMTDGVLVEQQGRMISQMPKEMKQDVVSGMIRRGKYTGDPSEDALTSMSDSVFGSAVGSSPLEVEVFDRFAKAIRENRFEDAKVESKELYGLYFLRRNAIEEGSAMLRDAQEKQAQKDFEEEKKRKEIATAAFDDAKRKYYGLESMPGVTEDNWPQFVDQKSGLLYKDGYSHQADIATTDWFSGMDDSSGTLGKFKNSMFSTDGNVKSLTNRARYDLTAAAKSKSLDAGVLSQYGMSEQALAQADKVIQSAYDKRAKISKDNAGTFSKQNEEAVAKMIPTEFSSDEMKPGSDLYTMFVKGASDPTSGLKWMAQAALLIAANEYAASRAMTQIGNVSSLNERIRMNVLDSEDRISAVPLLDAMEKYRNGELSDQQQVALKDVVENAAVGIRDYDDQLNKISNEYGVLRAKNFPVIQRTTNLPLVEGGISSVPATQSLTAKQILDFADELGIVPDEASGDFGILDEKAFVLRRGMQVPGASIFGPNVDDVVSLADKQGKPVVIDRTFSRPIYIPGAGKEIYEIREARVVYPNGDVKVDDGDGKLRWAIRNNQILDSKGNVVEDLIINKLARDRVLRSVSDAVSRVVGFFKPKSFSSKEADEIAGQI